MSLLPMAIVDALAGKIARTITPALQSALKELADHTPVAKPVASFFKQLSNPQSGGGSDSKRGSSSPSPAKLSSAISRDRRKSEPAEKPTLLQRLAAPFLPQPQQPSPRRRRDDTNRAALPRERQSQRPLSPEKPASRNRESYQPKLLKQERQQRDAKPKLTERISRIFSPPMEKSVVNKFIAAAEKRSSIEQEKSGQSFWKRGWGTLTNGVKRSAASRAARLTTIAAKRLSSAKRAVSASNKMRDQPGWHPAKHGNLLANKNSAAQKLAQATALQAKSTIFGAISSGRVASGLTNLASKIPMLASRVAIPAAIVAAAVRAPFTLAKMNDALIQSQLDIGYTKRRQDSISAYETKNQNIRTLNARDTEDSFGFLVDQTNQLKTTLRPFQVALKDASNYTQGGLAWVATKFFEGHQLQFDLAAAAEKSFRDTIQGAPSDPVENFKKIRADREKKRAEDEKIQSQQFSDIFGALAKGALSDQQMNLDNARFNNVTVQPLRPIL